MAPGEPDRVADSSGETAAAPAEPLRSAESARFTPGTLLAGRYRIVSPLGKGGMGEVYRADDTRLGQPVALKFLPAALAADAGRLERLVDEVRIGRQISHPNVCRLYDIAEAKGHHFMVMEYVDGEDLASLLRRIGRLPSDKALELARGMCAGLAAAHDKGVIHRDLKPANVMIDGHGHARIADFGLAALADRGQVGDLSGTPAYMAPEQLAGAGASLRSDVFALGLVFYETVTGKRAFEAKSLAELRALHSESRPLSLSSSARDLDPALERVILRCLAKDPAERPASASAVLASLPGGDPLQAAVLAGETPSPEMVAAAAKVGDLKPAVAWACLLAGLAGLLLAAGLTSRTALFRAVPLTKPPEVLDERARQVQARLGYREPAVDFASGFFVEDALLESIERSDASPSRWQRLRNARGGPLLFFHRESPGRLVAPSWIAMPPWAGPPELGRVRRRDPPLSVPGMSEVVLDSEGRLVGFVAVPPRFDETAGPWPEPDWSPLIVEAGFDPALLRAAAPLWAAPVDTDRKAAWEAVNPDQPDVPLRLEAGAYRGRVVWFELIGPWVEPPKAASEQGGTAQLASPPASEPLALRLANGLVFGLSVPFWIALAVLVRRNLRLGRGDRRGARRLAIFTFSCLVLAQLFRADHSGDAIAEHALLVAIAGQGLYAAGAAWLMYVALEPAVRRRWPHVLISWARLLAGRLGDPLVGRDVLAGALGGLALSLVVQGNVLVPGLLGGVPPMPGVAVLTSLSSPRHLLHFLLLTSCLAVIYSLGSLFFLYLFEAAVRNVALARLLLAVFLFVPTFSLSGSGVAAAIVAAAFSGILLLTLVRFGLLASAVLLPTFFVLLRTPLTLDASAWYAGRSFAVLGFFATLLVFSFHASLGGKPVFGRALLED